MSAQPITLMVARRVERRRYHEFMSWLREGERLATDFPGFLGSGVLAPPPEGDEFQMLFRFASDETMAAWEHSASRQAWLERGGGLFDAPNVRRAMGIDTWFGAAGQRPPRWKQAIAVWLAFFPVSLLFNALLGDALSDLSLPLRIFISTLILTPVMVFLFIPLSSHLLASWLNRPSPDRRLRASPPSPLR